MLVIHTVAVCRRCRGTTMWRLDKGNGHCDRCHRKKCVPRRRPSPVHLGALFGLLVIVAAGVAFASINLSAFLAREQRRVLLVDMDPQGHTTLGLLTDAVHPSRTMY